MATINQALNILRKAGLNLDVATKKDPEYFYKDKHVVTIEIPFKTPVNEEIEGTVKMPETHYKVYEGFSNAIDQYTMNLKHFENKIFGTYKIPEVREILYNGPATIVFWEDNTKTVVKVQPGEEYYDPDKAFAMAVCKKLFGNKFNRHLTKAQKAYEKSCEEEYDEQVEEFIKDPVKVIYCALDDFDKFWSKFNPSVKVGTFDPDSATTFKTEFKPKKEE